LIEGDKPGRSSLPLRGRQFFIMPDQPLIKQVEIEGEINQPALLTSVIKIKGQRLQHSTIQIRIGNARVIPQQVTNDELTIDLSTQSPTVLETLRAGGQTLQVLHPTPTSASESTFVGSNILPFVLSPTVIDQQVMATVGEASPLYSGAITAELDVWVNPDQRVFILLNQRSSHQSSAYVFPCEPRTAETKLLTFPFREIHAGAYLLRVQVDGAESLLLIDTVKESPTFEQYINPMIEIA
jgi:hypothetical protein